MKIIDVEQNTQAWFEARLGIPTASNFDKIVTMKGEPSKQAEKYLYRLAAERVSRQIENGYTNAFMERGHELEAEARKFYHLITTNEVKQTGLCLSDDGRYGCSPDGLVGDEGGLEIKCPIGSTQVAYLLSNDLPSEYYQQVQGTLLVTGRKWWDFVSYYPGLKPLIIRVTPDEAFQNKLKFELDSFCAKLDEVSQKIGA